MNNSGLQRCGLVIFSCLSLVALPEQALWAWDGRWTEASSGQYPLPDIEKPYKSSHSDSGLEKDRPQHYFIPPNPQFDDVDPNELSDNRGQDYSPYAMVRLPQNIQLYGSQKISKGYYLVKIAHWGDGSPRQKELMTKAQMQEPVPLQVGIPPEPTWIDKTQSTIRREKKPKKPYQVLIFKKDGKVLGIIPIERQESLLLSRRQQWKLTNSPLAWIEPDALDPNSPSTLKFYYNKMLYSTPVQTSPN